MKGFFLILFLISFVFAQDLGFPSQKLPPIICDDVFTCLAFFFEKILKIILALALALSTIFIAWAGILYITKGGEKQESVSKIHTMIKWAVVGLVVAFLSFAFVKALEIWISRGQVYLFKFVYAQIQEPSAPTSLNCGSGSLPSVFQGTASGQNIWRSCILFYVKKILSFLYIVALMLGAIFLSWSGILYITKSEKSNEIHKRLIYGVLGIIIAILSFTLVKIIDSFFTRL